MYHRAKQLSLEHCSWQCSCFIFQEQKSQVLYTAVMVSMVNLFIFVLPFVHFLSDNSHHKVNFGSSLGAKLFLNQSLFSLSLSPKRFESQPIWATQQFELSSSLSLTLFILLSAWVLIFNTWGKDWRDYCYHVCLLFFYLSTRFQFWRPLPKKEKKQK